MRHPGRRIHEHGSQRLGTLCGPSTRNYLHLRRLAAESGKTLPRLNANEYPHRFAKQIGLVHSRIGYVQRSLIELIIDGNGGSQEQVLLRIKDDAY